MKTTRKIGVVTALLVSLAFASSAQTTTSTSTSNSGGTPDKEWRLSVGPTFDLPIGNFSNAYNWSAGGFVQVDIPIISKLYVIADAGWKDNFAKSEIGSRYDVQQIPVMAGVKYFVFGNLIYVQGQAGAAFLTDKSKLNADKSTSFAYSPQVGVLLKIAHKNYLDLGFNWTQYSKIYNGGDNFNTLGLRLAYSFGL